MSRAFIKEDHDEPTPQYQLPDPESPYYKEAAAWALIQGADQGDSRSAELATSYRWGDPTLALCVLSILKEAEISGENRVAQLARRFLKATRQSESP
ncbi:MAG: hypothetical protein OSB36_04740 [Longimicrobiales bacterium]|nr:hypothetical protein [Longimicrobiales bacterium]